MDITNRSLFHKRNNSISLHLIVAICFFFLSCNSKDENYSEALQKSYDGLMNNKLDEGYKNVNKAIRLDNERIAGYSVRGRILFQMDKDIDALADFKRIIGQDSTNITALYYCGLIYYNLDSFDHSTFFLNKVIQAKGSDSAYIEFNNELLEYTYEENIAMEDVRFFRGLSYFYNAQTNLAAEDFAYSANNNYNKAESCYYMGLIGINNGRNVEACKYFTMSYNLGFLKAEKYISNYCQ